MKKRSAIKIAGGVTIFFFLMHIPFYWILDWKNGLACLNRDDWAIIMCFNIISIVLLLFMGILSLFHTDEIINTNMGKTFLLFASWFYFFRIFAEFIFFDEPNITFSLIIIILCAIPAVGYSIPLINFRNTK